VTEVVSIRPLLAVAVSALAVPAIASARSANVREAWSFAAAIVKFAIVLSMLGVVMKGGVVVWKGWEVLPGIAIAFRVDALGMVFALVASGLWIATTAYSIGYMRTLEEHSQTRYYCFFALALCSTLGVAFAANLLTLYLFYELLSLATYPLVTHHQDGEARLAGRKYLAYIMGSSIGFVLPAMVVVYLLTGTLDFTSGGVLAGKIGTFGAAVITLAFLFGFAKAAVMPFHPWLPAAMVAPTPVSALLHAVAVVKVGAFSIVRVMGGIVGLGFMKHLGLSTVVAAIASVTVLTASLIALTQDGLKRRLAFSTISQLSYIVLGVGLATPKALTGALLHIAMHALGKITLFFCAGAIFVATGKAYISEMVGIGRRMPVTMAAFFVGALGVIGLPPAGGFLSKWYLLLGTLEAHSAIFLFVLLASSLLNAAYFLPIVYRAFFVRPAESSFPEGVKEAPMWCVVPLVTTAAISVVLLLWPGPIMDLAKAGARWLLGG